MIDLLDRLRAAERGSQQLSAEWWSEITGEPWMPYENGPGVRRAAGIERIEFGKRYDMLDLERDFKPSVTESLDAAWAEAEARRWWPQVECECPGMYRAGVLGRDGGDFREFESCGKAPALALSAALLAAERPEVRNG